MRTSKKLAAAAAVAAVVTAAGSLASARVDVDGTTTTSDIHFFATPDEVAGHSTLRRTDDDIRATFHAEGVLPEHAVTLWWVVFNEPERCSAPGCGQDDIFVGGDPTAELDLEGIAAADIVAGFASGDVSSPDGSLDLTATLEEHEIGPEVIFGDGALLKDARRAEIHLVARSHGPAIEGDEDIQTGSFAGGCERDLFPPEIPESEGECADIQFSVHAP